MALKHVGRIASTRKKVGVAFRTLPGDAESCLVVSTESLSADEHDALMRCIESNAGQSADELADAMDRATLPDGRNMLKAFHKFGKLSKQLTKDVEMTPDTKNVINLAELNQMIADQKGVTIAELAGGTATTPEDTKPAEDVYINDSNTTESALTDEDIAKGYRSQANALYKEAAELRRKAEELVPTKKRQKSEQTE